MCERERKKANAIEMETSSLDPFSNKKCIASAVVRYTCRAGKSITEVINICESFAGNYLHLSHELRL